MAITICRVYSTYFAANGHVSTSLDYDSCAVLCCTGPVWGERQLVVATAITRSMLLCTDTLQCLSMASPLCPQESGVLMIAQVVHYS